MKAIAATFIIFLATAPTLAQHHHTGERGPAQLMAGLGDHHHPVTTRSAEAQRFFDQGLALSYGFNHEEAVLSFKRAAELDPEMAMAFWGVALALGPNINLDVDAERGRAAYEAVQKALSLASKVTEHERAYIEALAKRYSNDPKADQKKLNVDYKNAMAEVARRYPDDLDAATLYAESLMVLRPWQLWSLDGKPAEGTEEIVRVLESVLKRNPDHIGANHYYIHAVEASPHPEWALAAAQKLKTLAPAAGHLVHMPAHIDMRTGNYEAAARANAYGAEADRELFRSNGMRGMYPMMYYSHNLHFLAVAHGVQGRSEDSLRAARQLEAHMKQYFKDGQMPEAMMPMFDGFIPTPTLMLVRFRKWDDILKEPEPDRRLTVTSAIWHFARAMAYASTGAVDKAEAERNLFKTIQKGVPAQAMYGFSSTSAVLGIAENLMSAKIAVARSDKKSAVELLRNGAQAEDALGYNEPADWYIPVRESLGGALLQMGDYAEAERVFRADLEKNPRSGRSLFGLLESLKGQGKRSAAQFVEAQLKVAWKNADTRLRVEDL
jgi:tetratricopeptide (TPR) repeat protein